MAEHWVDKLKAKQVESEEHDRERTRLRLHKADVIKAKMPAFWSRLAACVKSDCAKLREAYSNDQQYHCTFETTGVASFRLLNTVPPRVILNVSYNEKGQFIDIEEFGGSLISRKTEQLVIVLTDNEELIINYRRESITDPETLAEYLCKRVAQVSS
jgi:hypothetical protein